MTKAEVYNVYDVENGFVVYAAKHAETCRKLGCKVLGGAVMRVYPPVGVTLHLPFPVRVGERLTHSARLVRKIETDKPAASCRRCGKSSGVPN